ncbi:TPA: DNA polymerase III subunit alpha [Candidatus Dependentiae bacterium]|nr:MAG: polymerase III, alpha subunit protein [candidate division TM6 bacterium GW2011_GWE2_31_21]KKP53019.1 MAG: polymerase III, alpha subunit protein [candidate division TM6 bacterium GW2011_GWF2_33_332]HBS47744.1 DNA polymerase III subunit alpha [Candidatus Dependentiae bacterium]HBZ73280.1 DNA polymerase III subunit alpha [Candidatus Dependentiae bacterium]
MEKHFSHLHLHTEFSLLDGAIKISELVKFAKEQAWKSIAISDHGNVFGAVKFFQECAKKEIKPILGCEMYITNDCKIKDVKEKYHHLLLLVENEEGYRNLCHLMAFSYKEGFYFKPRIDYEVLKKYSKGLIASSACIGGQIPRLLSENNWEAAQDKVEWFLDVFGENNFLMEVQPPDYKEQIASNEKIFELASKYDLPIIGTCDAHFLHKEDREAHEILLTVQTRGLFSDPDRYTFGDANCYLRTTQEMLDAFPGREEIVWKTGEIADRCEFKFTFGKLFFPKFEIPAEHDEKSYFKHLCVEGLEELKQKDLIPKDQYEIYDQRLKIEVDLITSMGFIGYFLVVSDFVRWAKNNGVSVGAGRGSAAGSLVAWALAITNVDPLKYNLLFERFLNPERISMPDIDIDFCIERREDVINYVRQKYGVDCVCQIITFGTMMAKGVIKDIARALGFPFKDAAAISDLIPEQLKITLAESITQEPRLKEMIDNDPNVKRLMDVALKLEGLTRHASKHAAGVVISPKPIEEMLPVYIPPKTDELVAQYTMTDLEYLGFLKMDFLGLKNLTLIERALKSIEKNHGVKINLDKLELTDPKTFSLLCKGNTTGVFQFESDGIKDVLRKLQPDKFEDLIAVNALYRPGPLGSGMVDDFIEGRHGRKKVTYIFDALKEVLEETYGVIVYQEQVMKIASVIGGYTLGGADLLRRAMGKKKADVMAAQKEQFVKGAKEKNLDEKKAADLFDLMAYFAGYGFNKSHSTAYALIAYHTAYLKANYPHEFMAALVSFETNDPDKLSLYLQQVSEMGIEVTAPNINISQGEFVAVNNGILFGLQGIKNVGLAALENIFEERKKGDFKDLLDFCMRVDLRVVNKRVIESLVCAGAMDCMPGNRAQKMNELDKIIDLAILKKEAARTGQMSLFGATAKETNSQMQTFYSFEPCEEWGEKEKLEKEKEIAGFYLSSHPLKAYNSFLKLFKFESFADTLLKVQNFKGQKEFEVSTCGILQTFKVINTKKGDRMAFAQVEDLSGISEIIIFPRVFAEFEKHLSDHKVFIIKGFVDLAGINKCKIKANSIIPLEKVFDDNKNLQNVEIDFEQDIHEEGCKQIKELTGSVGVPLNLFFRENNERLQLRSSYKIVVNIENIKKLEDAGLAVKCNLV